MARLRYMENARAGTAGTVCTHANKLFFDDTSAYIQASTSGQLNLKADKVTITGDLTITGTTTFDAIHVAFDQSLLENFTVGESGTGYDVKFWGDTGGKYWLWSAAANKVNMIGGFDIEGNVAITGNITSISGTLGLTGDATLVNANLSGALTVATTTGLIGAVTITPAATGTFLDFELGDWGHGTLINADFNKAEDLSGNAIGILLDFATNVTMITDYDVTGYQLKLPSFDQNDANDTVIRGFNLSNAGAIDQSSSAGTIDWRGVNIAMPQTTEATGTVTAYGIYLTSGTVSSGTQDGIYIAGASTLTDGIKIASAAVDAIELSAACTNYINISHVGTNAAIGLEFVNAFLGHSISTGSQTNLADGGVTLTATNRFNAGFFADDSGTNIAYSVRNVWARTLLTTTASASSIRSVMGHLKILTDIDVGTGVYTAVQGYIELVGNTDVATGGKMSGMDISLEVADGATFTIDSGGLFAGLKIETAGAGTITNGGTCCAIYIDDGGTVTDWPVGVDINNCTKGIDIGACTYGIRLSGTCGTSGITITTCTTSNIAISGTNATGIALTGTYSANGVVITTIPAAAMNGVFADLTASTNWTAGNIVGVRGKVTITATSLSSAAAVWAGIAITGSAAGNGLICAINAEVYSTKNTCPNAILYLQSLPSASDANFADVPYIVFSETVTSGTGSNILFELGSVAADTTTTVTSGTLFYHDTIQIAVNKTAGSRTAYHIPLSTVQGTFTSAYPIALSYTTAAALTVTQATMGNNVRGVRFGFTVATPAMQDGVGAFETDLSVTGAMGGAAMAASTWINIGESATVTGGSENIAPHTDGIYIHNSADISGAYLALCGRFSLIAGTCTSWTYAYLFDLNLDIDKDLTSLINVNNLALVNFTAGEHSSAVTGSIPFIGTGGSVKYIRVYDTAA